MVAQKRRRIRRIFGTALLLLLSMFGLGLWHAWIQWSISSLLSALIIVSAVYNLTLIGVSLAFARQRRKQRKG